VAGQAARTRAGGLHPNRESWLRDPRKAERSGFKLSKSTG
jgi:hypothetical protein